MTFIFAPWLNKLSYIVAPSSNVEQADIINSFTVLQESHLTKSSTETSFAHPNPSSSQREFALPWAEICTIYD